MSWDIQSYTRGADKAVYITIDSIDGDLESLIEDHIVKCYYGRSGALCSVAEAKRDILAFLDRIDYRKQIGAVSEFFMHIFLNKEQFIQECICRNLEEDGSLKKGFDGVYKDQSDELWFAESKSGDADGRNTHKGKIQVAYEDLSKKFSSDSSVVTNDPWMNAINHVYCSTNDESVVAIFGNYSNTYYKAGRPLDMNDLNIIPTGSLICDPASRTIYNGRTISDEVFDYFDTKDKKGLLAICVTNKALENFKAYLRR